MMRTTLLSALLAFSALAGAPEAFAADRAEAQSTPEFLDLSWADLLPEGEAERIAQLQQMQAVQNGMDHFGVERMPQVQTFNTVDALDGQVVRMGGYVLPFDFTGSREISRFLLVPYVGACIHVPPPPANQLIFVTTEDPYEADGLFEAVTVTGMFGTAATSTQLADVGYALSADRVEPYRR